MTKTQLQKHEEKKNNQVPINAEKITKIQKWAKIK